MVMKKILIALALLLTGIASGSACTGISFLAEDGGYVQARTIEWGNSYLPSEYVVVPRGQELVSYTPTGVNGLRFRAKYVTPQQWGGVTIFPFGAGAGFHGIPGDVTPPSRFVRVAFYKATASACPTAYDTILQSFHILNNFDIPVGIEHASGKAPDIPSATQWTSAIDLTNRKVYYKTAYNNNIRCINMKKIDFDKVKYQSYPLDKELKQPIEEIIVK